jgi:hypothetical protein
MIIRINRHTPHCPENIPTASYISGSTYPTQNSSYLNKIVLIRFKDERYPDIINNRFKLDSTKYPTYTGTNTGTPSYFLVLRYDSVSPYRVILLGSKGEVVVTTVTAISSLSYPTDYTGSFTDNSSTVSAFKDRTELFFTKAASTDAFLSSYTNEFIFNYPIQEEKYLGINAYTEYYADFSLDHSVNKVVQTTPKTRAELAAESLVEDGTRNIIPEEVLLSDPLFFDNHNHDMVDTPRRSFTSGLIIRADAGNTDKEFIVVAETVDSKLRFVVSDEAYMYIDSTTTNTKIYDRSAIISAIDGKSFTGGLS